MYVLLNLERFVCSVSEDLEENETMYFIPSKSSGFFKQYISAKYENVTNVPDDYEDGMYTFDGENWDKFVK